jgi:hypothetical protein
VIDSPRIGWKVLLELLPHGMSTTSGTHKPRWRNPVPEDWKPKVTRGEHWAQVQQYAQMAVDLAGEDFERLVELTDRLDDLPKPSFDALLDLLESKSAAGLDSAQKSKLWGGLTKFTKKHRRFPDAKWALPAELLDRVDEAAGLFRPEEPRLLYKPLFSNNDFDLYEGHESYEEEQEKLTEKRKYAVRAILGAGGLNAIKEFSTDVESPHALGRAAAELESAELDRSVLPELLTSDEMEVSAFASSYAFVRFLKSGEKWLDDLNRDGWSRIQCCALLKSLPFDQPTWDRVDPWVGRVSKRLLARGFRESLSCELQARAGH